MSVLTSVGILLLAMLIMAFLQLVPSVFALFAHFASGKYSRKKATDLMLFYILGAETAVVLMFLSVYAILCASPAISFVIDSDVFAWIMAGICVALSIAVLGCYYRKGKGGELFIPRSFAQNLLKKFPNARKRSDAFVMGLFTTVPELVFTLPLYVIAGIVVMRLGESCPERAGLAILYALAAIVPLLIIYGLSNVHNLADYIKFRFQNKNFFRFAIALYYLLIAILIILGVIL